ncbi:MAG: EF-P beta-lysylation protein EpmB [Planctomycetaceae bacterium]
MQSRPSWQRQLANAIRSSTELLAALGLPVPNPPASGTPQESTATGFPTLVPISFLNRMEFGNADDPLLKQVLPTSAENLSVAGFVSDPVNDEAARIAPGLLQKYAGRVLLIATGACAVHCRYCFRRDYPYQQEPRTAEDWQPAINRIANDHSITEVILSGGDPLILNDDRLSSLCRQLDAISNIERLRLHTRLPIVLPDRVTSSLLNLLTSLRSQTIVVVHSNHGNEIAGDCEDALKRLVRSGIPVLNQTVLLHGINDSVEALETLSRRLVNAGVIPYYLHHLDRVQGAAHFESDRDLGIRLLQELRKRLPGYAVPQFVEEIPGEPGKTLI